MKIIDGNIVDEENKVLLFSKENFATKICEGKTCFICGDKYEKKDFNDEHVIPRWILKKFSLFEKTISLPNGKTFKYGKYKISCCKECNSLLGTGLEKKVSEGFGGDVNSSLSFFNENKELIFQWVCLLYIKTHLKDREFISDFKKRDKISDSYEWERLHHTYCIARSIYSGVIIDEKTYGSMFFFECDDSEFSEPFDYIDLYGTGTVMVKLRDFTIICVIDDSKIVHKLIDEYLKKITGKVNDVQLRELYARITDKNLRIIDKPKYFTAGNYEQKKLITMALIKDEIRIANYSKRSLGGMMFKLVENLLYKPKEKRLEKLISKQIRLIKKGEWTFLFDKNGKFLQDAIFKVNDENVFLETFKAKMKN
ncbi:hypothetical protein MC862_001618 [Proteus mirabilis]|uniref:hypothetical protein n=1 Tax=Enterobacterales TaxID=91347 RepID=UPI000F890521|nr:MULTISPECIES: hypothetical protein [Enterobacterales]EKU4146070.1 hypothetical protein [Proteus mirabilis]MBW9413403.1 hypothetical protein [Enterobacter hormaechei]RUL09712.1 hypothetical protein ELP66_10400 [Proteus mirabilis]